MKDTALFTAKATPIGLGIIGVGTIARAQHLPAIAMNSRFSLMAAVSRHGSVQAIPNFVDIDAMIAGSPLLRAVTLCAPPGVRSAMARRAIAANLHVMLEKPPGVTVSEVLELAALARGQGTTLFASWHSREAPGVPVARQWLSNRTIVSVHVRWFEDVRVWHPGQEWIWQPGGFGVFDPGINALSILTHVLPAPLVMCAASLSFPQNRDAPMSATLSLRHAEAPITAEFSFNHPGAPCWDIDVQTTSGILRLTQGASHLYVDDVAMELEPSAEYPTLYDRFASLIAGGRSDVDVSPLQLAADAFACARRIEIEPFHYEAA